MWPRRSPFLRPKKLSMSRGRSSTSAAAGCCSPPFRHSMKALTAAEMREVDRLTIERYGASGLQLMENAGGKAADAVWRVVAGRNNVQICVLCGQGNNKGDGFVIARVLKSENILSRVVLFGKREEIRDDAAINLTKWTEAGSKIECMTNEADWRELWPELSHYNIFVDAMLNTGLKK